MALRSKSHDPNEETELLDTLKEALDQIGTKDFAVVLMVKGIPK